MFTRTFKSFLVQLSPAELTPVQPVAQSPGRPPPWIVRPGHPLRDSATGHQSRDPAFQTIHGPSDCGEDGQYER